MKIAIIREECSFTKGGAERYAANLCNCLCELGHQVWLLAATAGQGLNPAITHVPVAVNRTTSASRTLSFHRNAQKAVASLPVDRVFALSRSFPADAFRVSDPIHRYWMAIRYPGKVHRFLQTLNPRHRAILDLEGAIFNPENTRCIVTNSALSKRIIGEHYTFPAERIHVVYNGVDLNKFSPATENSGVPNDGEVRLLFVGQDFKRKGLAPLIRAMADLKAADVRCRLRVIGRDRPAPYMALAKELGVDGLIRFEEASGKIHEAYRAADLMVFPTLYDPFANVCLESLACGLPVLTTTTNGSFEVITEGEDGYVVDGGIDGLAERLAEKIRVFCALPPDRRVAMRTSARTKAEGFTIAQNARTIVGVFDALSAGTANERSAT
jgi:UDP-glucose:(heptosyl)LPS alpha-1,3-glucosyltransferase